MTEQKLKKVVILTYFFPPCNLTASQRSFSWAKHLHEFGYYPIIITRNWEHHIETPDDMHHESGKDIIHEKNENYEVFYVPFRGNLRDKLYSRYGKNKFNLLRKALSFMELFAHHFSNKAIPFYHIYDFAHKFLSNHKDIQVMVVTGNPFEIFRFGYQLHMKFKIPWIADYRDDWNTSEVNKSRGWADSILRNLEKRSEKKYISTASSITSVSPYYAQKIGSFVSRPGHVLLNGFFEDDFLERKSQENADAFTIVYNGMLYPSQEIEVFLAAFKRFVEVNRDYKSRIKLKFPGILFLKDQANRVEMILKGYEEQVELTGRIPRDKVIDIQAQAHLLLMISHKNSKGIPSSKIYEYLALAKPVMVCPGDGDILDETFQGYNLGYIAKNEEDAFNQLNYLFHRYLKNEYDLLIGDQTYIDQFSRKKQTQILAKLLDETIQEQL